MKPNEKAAIGKSPSMDEREKLVREFLLRFSLHWPRDLTPLLISSWCDAVAHITDLNALRAAFERTIKTRVDRTAFPAPGDVLQHIEAANAVADGLELQDAWQGVLRYISRWYYGPDVGLDRNAPPLTPDVEHAVRCAGGIRRIESMPEDELVWAKKAFLQDLAEYRKSEQVHSLSTGEARAFLAECMRQMNTLPAPRRSLPAPPQPSPLSAEELAHRRKIAAAECGRVWKAVHGKETPPPPKPTPEELQLMEQAEQAQHAALDRFVQAHPEQARRMGLGGSVGR